MFRLGYETKMSDISTFFVTRVYRASLNEVEALIDVDELEKTCYSIARDDEAGQTWCEENDFPGYTSYASLDDLPWRFPVFKSLVEALNVHINTFAEDAQFDLGDRALTLNSLWINVLPEGGMHSSHIHPQSVISGTMYVSMPAGASAIKFEDPRLPMMMASPPRVPNVQTELRTFNYIQPNIGDVLLWESWLRHEVPMNLSEGERISVSFNYGWD